MKIPLLQTKTMGLLGKTKTDSNLFVRASSVSPHLATTASTAFCDVWMTPLPFPRPSPLPSYCVAQAVKLCVSSSTSLIYLVIHFIYHCYVNVHVNGVALTICILCNCMCSINMIFIQPGCYYFLFIEIFLESNRCLAQN